jgi:hypothetical protein
MPPTVGAADWPEIDDWWGSCIATETLRFAPAHLRALIGPAATTDWDSVDECWAGFASTHEALFIDAHQQPWVDEAATDAWATIDGFWDGYATQQAPALEQLRNLLTAVRDRWRAGASVFDADPLTANWQASGPAAGPLRSTVDEEDWSQWLAHVLQSSSGPFVTALLELPEHAPETVRREVVFSDADTTRRIDILVEYPEAAVSIEVKNGDTNYGKTPETARLIEQESGRDWTHVLLLRRRNRAQLEHTFGDRLVAEEPQRPRIESEAAPPVEVCYWEDVSHALRRMLTGGHEPDSHWQASAYLFVTLIEQRILNLHSADFIDPETAPAGGSAAHDLHRLVALDPERQIDYLETLLGEDNHE